MADEDPIVLTKVRLELGLRIRLLDLVAKQWAHLLTEEK